ncbi:MAG: hypothetical protein WAN72_08450 [Candidatus Acidiferrales bacterium]
MLGTTSYGVSQSMEPAATGGQFDWEFAVDAKAVANNRLDDLAQGARDCESKNFAGAPAEDARATFLQQGIAGSPSGDEFPAGVQLKQEFAKLTNQGDKEGMLI